MNNIKLFQVQMKDSRTRGVNKKFDFTVKLREVFQPLSIYFCFDYFSCILCFFVLLLYHKLNDLMMEEDR